jgi:hypothetical protein
MHSVKSESSSFLHSQLKSPSMLLPAAREANQARTADGGQQQQMFAAARHKPQQAASSGPEVTGRS